MWSDHFTIEGAAGFFYVTHDTAADVVRQLTRRWPPRWVGFVELHGARVRVRSRDNNCISETAHQRQLERDFTRALRRERKKDRRPWEDDD